MEKLVASEETEQEYTYAILAKADGGGEDEWLNMGDVQHVRAAEELARIFDYDGIVLTKRKDSSTIWKHRVSREVKYNVTPLREGS
jgi:hypothetical protein